MIYTPLGAATPLSRPAGTCPVNSRGRTQWPGWAPGSVPAARPLTLIVASISKLVFIGLVLANGLGGQAAVPITIDLIVTGLFVLYLLELRRARAGV